MIVRMRTKKRGAFRLPFKLVGGRISALPTRPVLNTVQFTSLLELQGSYDCTLPLLPDTFPLEDTRIFSHSLKTSRRQS